MTDAEIAALMTGTIKATAARAEEFPGGDSWQMHRLAAAGSDLLARAQRAEGERDEAVKLLREMRDAYVTKLEREPGPGDRHLPIIHVDTFLASLPTSPEESKGERT